MSTTEAEDLGSVPGRVKPNIIKIGIRSFRSAINEAGKLLFFHSLGNCVFSFLFLCYNILRYCPAYMKEQTVMLCDQVERMGVDKGGAGRGHGPPGFSYTLTLTYQISKILQFYLLMLVLFLLAPP